MRVWAGAHEQASISERVTFCRLLRVWAGAHEQASTSERVIFCRLLRVWAGAHEQASTSERVIFLLLWFFNHGTCRFYAAHILGTCWREPKRACCHRANGAGADRKRAEGGGGNRAAIRRGRSVARRRRRPRPPLKPAQRESVGEESPKALRA